MSARLLLYGVSGYTGALVHAAVKDALGVTAAARRDSAAGIACLSLDDPDALRRELQRHDAVLNCAGPFAHTWRPLVEACLDTGTHYLDLCAEWRVFEALRALDGVARERGVMLLPGVGFDIVASDSISAYVAARLPGAQRLEIGIAGLELASRGSGRTMLDLAGEDVRVRRGGEIVADRRLLEARFDFGAGPRAAYAVSWGDVATAGRRLGIPDVEVYFEATPLLMGLTFANRSFGWLARSPFGQRLMRAQVELLPRGPTPQERAGRRAVLVARASDAAGSVVEARLSTPEAYSFTALSARAIARRVLAGDVRAGFQTPAGLLGEDFVLGLEGVKREDRPQTGTASQPVPSGYGGAPAR